MERRLKTYITSTGQAVLVDPDLDHLRLIRRLNPGFNVRSEPPPADFVPNLVRTRAVYAGTDVDDLCDLDRASLWDLHNRLLRDGSAQEKAGEATLLDVKIELA